jgi:hypothetical protein
MARLLRDLDYLRVIKSDTIDQVIESNQQVRLDVEQAAQTEMISYLAQRYIVGEVFTDTTVFSISATYRGKNLVEFTADAYDTGSTYNADDYALHSGSVYKCNADSTTGTWNASKWDLVCLDKTLYYAKLNHSEWDSDSIYAKNAVVWYQNYAYTAKQANTNILPSDTNYWTKGSEYTFTTHYPDDTAYWTKGDNRNQQIVLFLIDICLYHLHSRINPRNIPDLRKERYNGNDPMDRGGAIGWLKSVAHGNVMADLPQIIAQQGMSMRSGNTGTNTSPSPNMMW